MNFVHLSILAALSTVSIPLILHMLGRKQPQLVDFPALRFVRQTKLEQSSSWKLRHILLLMLRMLLLATLAFALARPRVHSATMGSMIGISGLILLAALASLAAAIAWVSKRPATVWGLAAFLALLLWSGSGIWAYRSLSLGPALPTSDTTAPVAVAMIIDTSPAMNYQSKNKSRLEEAVEMSAWLLDRLPVDSHVGVFQGLPMASLSQSPQAAATQISRITRTTERVDLLGRLKTAIDLVLADELERKEIYILTDMSSAPWGSSQNNLAQLLDSVKDQLLVQIVDLGIKQPINWQLGDPSYDFNTVPAGSDITFRVPVSQLSDDGKSSSTLTVELWKEEIDPKLPILNKGKLQLPASSVVARRVVNFSGDGTSEVELVAKKLPEGIHHFAIRFDKNDPLTVDNQRFVTITAKGQQPTLIVSNNSDAARALQLMMDPRQEDVTSVDSITFAQLSQAVLTRYSVIVLFDPPSLGAKEVKSLKEHALGGGGLMLILGRSLQALPGKIDETPIAELLPGSEAQVVTRPVSDRSEFWNPTSTTHPVYQDLEFPPNEIAWQLMPIFSSWNFAKIKTDVQVLAALSGTNSPLLTSQPLGSGQVFTLTTPIPEFEQPRVALWNELWIAEQYWWSFGVLSGCIRTLSGANQSPLTFLAGSSVTLANDPNQWPKNWELYSPSGQRSSVEAASRMLNTGTHSEVGTYHLRGNMGTAVTRGFSVNVSASDTTLTKIDSQSLNALLGADNYHVAQQRAEIETSVGQARFGKELYPLIMLFVAGIFLAEQVMSNRFYSIQLRFGKAAKG
jgi:Aerotolerance regulator N-terminal